MQFTGLYIRWIGCIASALSASAPNSEWRPVWCETPLSAGALPAGLWTPIADHIEFVPEDGA